MIAVGESIADIARRLKPLGYPLIVKPDNGGSSLGIALADQPADLAGAVSQALKLDTVAVAEPLIRGREFTVAVLDDRALPLVEIVTPERFFSYDAKYRSSLTEYRIDFDLPAPKRVEVVHAAVAAARALGTSGLARVDVMLDHDGNTWVLEINTIPGMTPRSLAPQAALQAGLDMTALCDLLVRQCLVPAGVS